MNTASKNLKKTTETKPMNKTFKVKTSLRAGAGVGDYVEDLLITPAG
ncbi:MAG: hypothetical protein HRT35_30790 [Algicola sp.]|nr:hypothetical protein [Algicola sp.]